MKNILPINSLFVSLAVIFGGALIAFAQTEVPMAGGYQKIAATDASATMAANFAVKAEAKKQTAKIKIVLINQAERQVVAGMNYRLCLKVEITGKNKKTISQIVQAIVFQNLKQKMSLTSWEESDCFKDVPEPPND